MTEPGRAVVLHFRTGTTLHCELARQLREGDETISVSNEAGTRDVSLAELKAAFFLREQAEDPGVFDPSWSKLSVEFTDGELIRGVAAQYAPSQASFFLFPLERSKNERILVVSSAVASIDAEKL